MELWLVRWVAQLARAISRSAPPFLPALLLSSTSTENFCGPASVVGPRHRTFVCFVECCVVLPLGAFFRNPSLCLQRTQHLFNRKIVRQKVEYLGLHTQKCIQQRKYFRIEAKTIITLLACPAPQAVGSLRARHCTSKNYHKRTKTVTFFLVVGPLSVLCSSSFLLFYQKVVFNSIP